MAKTIEEKVIDLEKQKFSLTQTIAIFEHEINELLDKKKRVQDKINEITEDQKDLVGKEDQFKTSYGTFFWKKTTVCNIIDKELIPDDYIKTKTTTTVDKAGIKKRIEAGEEIPGAEVVNNFNFQIKKNKE
jgi:FtsZ-binding cell division protein ZapB